MTGHTIMVSPGASGRRELGWALLLTGGLAGLFVLFALVTTQVGEVRAASPWNEDPYDAVVSFTMFFVPLIACYGCLRVLLCRRFEPVEASRLDDLGRTAAVLLGAVGATVAVDWIAVGAEWTLSASRPLLAALAVLTLTWAAAGRALARAGRARTWPAARRTDRGTDCWDDLGRLARTHLPVWGLDVWIPRVLAVVLDRRHGLRRHRSVAVAAAATAFGSALSLNEVRAEGGSSDVGSTLWLVALVILAGTCGMLTLLIVAGRSLAILRRAEGVAPLPRPLAWAGTAAPASVWSALALRDHVPFVSRYADSGSPRDLALRLITVGLLTGVAAAGAAWTREHTGR